MRDSLRRALELDGYGVELAEDGARRSHGSALGSGRGDPRRADARYRRPRGVPAAATSGNSVPILMLTARPRSTAGSRGSTPAPTTTCRSLRARRAARSPPRDASRAGAGDTSGADMLRFSNLELDPRTRDVVRAGGTSTSREPSSRCSSCSCEILARCSRVRLSSSVCGATTSARRRTRSTSTSAISVGRPRRPARLIHTVRGVGYALREKKKKKNEHVLGSPSSGA